MAEVTISTMGRCGLIFYREGAETARFDWEFGGSVIALLWGAKKSAWDESYPWARGRQAEIYDFVAKEVIRQKAPNSRAEINLVSGAITVL
jgi:hypothetical protein